MSGQHKIYNKTHIDHDIQDTKAKTKFQGFYSQGISSLSKLSVMWHSAISTLISFESLTLVSLKCAVGPSGKWHTNRESTQQLRTCNPMDNIVDQYNIIIGIYNVRAASIL